MSFILISSLVGLGILMLAFMRWSQQSLLRSKPPEEPGVLPPVSILKPLKGVDANLEANLRSFFELDYPEYEILFGAEDLSDPAIAVAQKVSKEYPHIRSLIIAEGRRVGLNPKVNNLANIAPYAQHEIFLISDSNVSVQENYLLNLVSHLQRPGVGLVTSPFRARGGKGLGSVLEGIQLHTFVMGGVSAVNHVFKRPCVVGKSMLMRKQVLEEIGGFHYLARYLGEDQVCGEEIFNHEHGVAVSEQLIDNVHGELSVKQFAQRHLRWAKIRRHFNASAYAAEILLNPVFISIAAALIWNETAFAALALITLTTKAALDFSSERALGVQRDAYLYPALTLSKDLIIGCLWIVPFFQSNVNWRGNVLRIGKRTRLHYIPNPVTLVLSTSPNTQKIGAA